MRCFDPAAAEAMIVEIKAAAKDGDSLGGVVEVLAYGVPVGLGSHVHWDRKLDALLAQAVMSIQAVKGVEIGDGFEVAGRRGSEAHDPIRWDADGSRYRRDTTLAGGIEGGMSTGELLVVRAAMKPLATLNVPVLETVDTATKESAVSFKERTDVTAVPAMGVVAETMVALVLAGRGAAQVRRRLGRRVRPQRRRVPRHAPATADRRSAARSAHRARRDDGRRQDDGRARSSPHASVGGWSTPTSSSRPAPGARCGRSSQTDGEPAFRVLETAALVEALDGAEPLVIAAAGGVRAARREPRARCNARRLRRVAAGRPGGARRAGDAAATTARCSTAIPRPRCAGCCAEREPLYREVADVVVDVDDRVARRRSPTRIVELAERAIRRVTVPLGDRAYDVVVGHGAVATLPAAAGHGPAGGRRDTGDDPVRRRLPIPHERLEIGHGEAAQDAGDDRDADPRLRRASG